MGADQTKEKLAEHEVKMFSFVPTPEVLFIKSNAEFAKKYVKWLQCFPLNDAKQVDKFNALIDPKYRLKIYFTNLQLINDVYYLCLFSDNIASPIFVISSLMVPLDYDDLHTYYSRIYNICKINTFTGTFVRHLILACIFMFGCSFIDYLGVKFVCIEEEDEKIEFEMADLVPASIERSKFYDLHLQSDDFAPKWAIARYLVKYAVLERVIWENARIIEEDTRAYD
jgi:hypothetical protein